MFECFHCLQRAVIWDNDFDFDDFGYEGRGIVHCCHCTNCGAEIEIRVPCEEVEEPKSICVKCANEPTCPTSKMQTTRTAITECFMFKGGNE